MVPAGRRILEVSEPCASIAFCVAPRTVDRVSVVRKLASAVRLPTARVTTGVSSSPVPVGPVTFAVIVTEPSLVKVTSEMATEIADGSALANNGKQRLVTKAITSPAPKRLRLVVALLTSREYLAYPSVCRDD